MIVRFSGYLHIISFVFDHIPVCINYIGRGSYLNFIETMMARNKSALLMLVLALPTNLQDFKTRFTCHLLHTRTATLCTKKSYFDLSTYTPRWSIYFTKTPIL